MVHHLAIMTDRGSQRASEDPCSFKVRVAVSELIALADGYETCNRELLSFFNEEIERIVEKVLSHHDGKKVFTNLSIARECHRQALIYEGTLNCAQFFRVIGQPSTRGQSTDAFDHEALSAIEESIEVWPHVNFHQKAEGLIGLEQRWVVFWTKVLRNSPGPTLFDPDSSHLFSSFDFHLNTIPRYIFRTFDSKSFGRTDDVVVASPANESGTVSSRIDILSQNESFAMSVVDRHMNPWRVKNYESHKPDNLMSWTSSFLYAIQYAFYRRYHHGCDSEDIKICVVDTDKFPRGQFVHAKRLLEAFYRFVKRADMRQFFDLRLLVYIYQNGEYLSQGILNHRGRSRVISLAQLEASGLYSLYPEFADSARHTKWAVTTAYLRSLWTPPQISTHRELETALALAKNCFAGFPVLDIAIIILSFKRRVLERIPSGESCRSDFRDNVNTDEPLGHTQHVQNFPEAIPEWGRKPQEVQQYLTTRKALQSILQIANGKLENIFSAGSRSDEIEDSEKQVVKALYRYFRVQ